MTGFSSAWLTYLEDGDWAAHGRLRRQTRCRRDCRRLFFVSWGSTSPAAEPKRTAHVKPDDRLSAMPRIQSAGIGCSRHGANLRILATRGCAGGGKHRFQLLFASGEQLTLMVERQIVLEGALDTSEMVLSRQGMRAVALVSQFDGVHISEREKDLHSMRVFKQGASIGPIEASRNGTGLRTVLPV